MSGSATFTIVTSSSSMKTPTETAVSVHHFRAMGGLLGGSGKVLGRRGRDRMSGEHLFTRHLGRLLRDTHLRAHAMAHEALPGGRIRATGA